ncbi:MAG: hypothetical protein EHM39_14110 [Chloroflexi bacterium]|nr:MAG: hypothetical protein EHM39_14110 [Chloroflexota bacterium]
MKYRLSQAHQTIQARLERANLLDSKPPLHQIVRGIAELSGIPMMPIYGRIEQEALHAYGALQPSPDIDHRWLEFTAAVRPALARVEAHQLGTEPNLQGWCNRTDPWTFAGNEIDANVKQPMNVVVCYAPADTLHEEEITGETLAAAVLDSWSEMIPAKQHVVETAFGFNAPSSRAPQAILLAVPPDETRPLDTETLAHIIMEARETAHARMATPDDIAAYASLLPFAMFASQPPTGVDMKPFDPFES